MRGESGLYDDLTAAKINHKMFEHPAVFTVEESRAIKTDIPCLHTKNLFLKDAVGKFLLLTVPAEARIDLKRVPAELGCKRLSFGKPDDMQRLLGVTPGSVTPLAMINAQPGAVQLVLDQPLSGDDLVGVHPLRNTATITLAGSDILSLTQAWGHQPLVLDLPKIDPG